MGINGTYTSGSYSTYIRNYNSNSGKGRLPAYIAQKEQNEQKAQQLEQNTRQNNQIALSKVQSAQTQIASTINVNIVKLKTLILLHTQLRHLTQN